MPTPSPTIVASGLSKNYGKLAAVRDLSLEVGAGEVFGFLGPNGAGKTTTIRMLTRLVPRPVLAFQSVVDWGLPVLALASVAAIVLAARLGMRRLDMWEAS